MIRFQKGKDANEGSLEYEQWKTEGRGRVDENQGGKAAERDAFSGAL